MQPCYHCCCDWLYLRNIFGFPLMAEVIYRPRNGYRMISVIFKFLERLICSSKVYKSWCLFRYQRSFKSFQLCYQDCQTNWLSVLDLDATDAKILLTHIWKECSSVIKIDKSVANKVIILVYFKCHFHEINNCATDTGISCFIFIKFMPLLSCITFTE